MYRNLIEALIGSLTALQTKGASVPSRNGETKELYCHQVRIAHPEERFLVTPARGANPFAQLAEALWVLGGRNDVEFLSRYLPRAGDFSDDGTVWRGGYGPRLRAWGATAKSSLTETGIFGVATTGIDQLAKCYEILKAKLDSRQAVMVIFDPANDFVASKDIPCNNWLHFLVRDGKLNLTVGVRSNDVIWGFSGINVFEWSLMMEMMACWLGVEVGTMGYTASSFHLYEYHYEKAEKIVTKARGKTLYDFGLPRVPFQTPFEDFDAEMRRFFDSEVALAHGFEPETPPTDPFLAAALQALRIHHMVKQGVEPKDIVAAVDKLPASDLRVAIVEALKREPTLKNVPLVGMVNLSEPERKFFQWYNNPPEPVGVADVFATLKVLHEKKTRSYGNSWRKHGEVLGVFSNITRKWDRIGALAKGAQGLSDEGFLDTVADLCIYAGKYLTLLAELYPVAFTDFLQERVIDGQTFICDADPYTGLEGFDVVLDMLPVAFPESGVAVTKDDLLGVLEEQYKRMEKILMAPTRTEAGKVVIPSAACICIFSAHLICLIAQEDPRAWEGYVATVERL